MKTRNKAAIAGGAMILAVTAAGVGVVSANRSDDAEAPIPASSLGPAEAAALAHTGQGRVTDTEVGDEDSYYEVEVTLDDGTEVDVQLDERLNVVSSEAESPGETESDGASKDMVGVEFP